MKTKNVNFFQRHVEKLVLGAALLIAALLVLTYVAGTPYTAEIAGQSLGPIEIQERVEDLALQLDRDLKSDGGGVPDREVPPYTEDFVRRVERNIAPSAYRITLGPPALDPSDVMPPQPPDPYNLPHPPLPTGLAANAGYGVLGMMDNATVQQALLELIGDQQPLDFRYVSVSGVIDLDEWHERLLATPAIPNQFYRSMIGIAGVYLQRQTFDPATGEWGQTQIIDPLPGQVAYLPDQTFDYTDQQAEQLVNYLQDNQQQIARPEFPPLAGQNLWLPPWSDIGKLTPQEQREFRELGGQITTLKARRERLIRRMERAGEQPRQAPPQPTQPGDMFDRGGRRPPPQPRDEGSEMAQQLARLDQEIYEKQARYDELIGVPQDMNQGAMPGLQPPQPSIDMPSNRRDSTQGRPPFAQPPSMDDRRAVAPGQAAEPEDREVTVWAHDLTVEPGKTYRYRVLVSVLNPLFRQTRVEERQRQEHFNKVALGPDMSADGEVATSPWSEPVEVHPEYYFFFVQGGQSPRVEVWHIYDGVWRSEQFAVQPGDPIGGQMQIQVNGEVQTIDMNVGAVVVDLMDAGSSNPLGGNDARLLYLAPGSDQIASRSVEQDSNSDKRIEVQNERTIQQERARQASASAQQ